MTENRSALALTAPLAALALAEALALPAAPAAAAPAGPAPKGLTLAVSSATVRLDGPTLTAQAGVLSDTDADATFSAATASRSGARSVGCAPGADPAWTVAASPAAPGGAYRLKAGAPTILTLTASPAGALAAGTHLVGVSASASSGGQARTACSYLKVYVPAALAAPAKAAPAAASPAPAAQAARPARAGLWSALAALAALALGAPPALARRRRRLGRRRGRARVKTTPTHRHTDTPSRSRLRMMAADPAPRVAA